MVDRMAFRLLLVLITAMLMAGMTAMPALGMEDELPPLDIDAPSDIADANHKAATSAAAKLTVNPKATWITSLKGAAGSFTVTWNKRSSQTTGYQVRFATDAGFTKGVKTATIAKNATTSKKFTGLKAKTKYWVKVRAYKTYDGGKTKYFSAWSAAKTVTTGAQVTRA